jgi:hypothetical protein
VRISVAGLLAGLALVACKKSEESTTRTNLAKLGLTFESPVPVTVDDVSADAQTIIGARLEFAIVVEPIEPTTLDAAKEKTKMFEPVKLDSETLPDGFALWHESKISAHPTFFAEVDRKIGNNWFRCSASGTEAGQRMTLALCKSLRAAK